MAQAAYQPGYLKSKNRKLIFDLFAREDTLSRADIVRLTGMSFPTASKAVDYLLSQNILVELAPLGIESTETGPGRRSHILQFNPGVYNAVGIEFEGNFAEIGLVDMSGHILKSHILRFSQFDNPEEIRHLAGHVHEMLEEAEVPVLGVGIGCPFNVNPRTDEIVSFSGLNINSPVSFKKLFAPFFEVIPEPVCLDNDVNLACLGEAFLQGREKEVRNLAFFTLGTGFGAGFIMDAHLWRGSGYRAGEIGNTVLTPLAAGASGTQPMELDINIAAINKQFGLAIEEDPSLTDTQIHDIIDFILPGLVTSLHNFVYVLDIEQFVFSGYIPRILGEAFYKRLTYSLNRALENRARKVTIVPPKSSNSVLVGAASMMFDSLIFDQLTG